MKRFCIVLVLAVFVSFGCAEKVTTKPEVEQPQKEQKAEEMKTEKPAEAAPEAQKETGMEKAEVVKSEEAEAVTPGKEGMFKDIHFDFDRYSIEDADRGLLKSIAAWMRKNTSAKLTIEGHCDDRGTNEYNLALGDRRAKAVKDYLVSLGVPSSRIDTISFGEEKPLCTEQTEECWAKNRRAHFVVLK
jgi:peptidoglycan-associated lipoprotein